MIWLYNILLMISAVMLAPVLLYRMAVRGKYRTGFKERLGFIRFRPGETDGRWTWIHAVSVGEVQVALPLINRLKQSEPGLKIFLTTTTDTGQKVAQKAGAHRVAYFPCDLPGNAARVLRQLRPKSCLIVETEIWPNFLAANHRLGIKTALVNGRISDRSFRRYRLARFLSRSVLNAFEVFCMQSQDDAARITALGAAPSRVIATGNLKFDRALELVKSSPHDVKAELGIAREQPVLIAGSIHGPEGDIVIDAYQRLRREFPDLILFLAPRHLELLEQLESSLRASGLRAIRKTALTALQPQERGESQTAFPFDVILLDTMGELALMYQASTIAFVGGSLIPHGGQNVLEPAILGKPVLFGPHMENFKESTRLLLAEECAFMVRDAAELTVATGRLLRDPALARTLGERAGAVVRTAAGATEATYRTLKDRGFF